MKLTRRIFCANLEANSVCVLTWKFVFLLTLRKRIESNIQWFVFFGIYVWILSLFLYSINLQPNSRN